MQILASCEYFKPFFCDETTPLKLNKEQVKMNVGTLELLVQCI